MNAVNGMLRNAYEILESEQKIDSEGRVKRMMVVRDLIDAVILETQVDEEMRR